MALQIYSVNQNLKHLVLVRNGRVINGHYDLFSDKNGNTVDERSDARYYFVMDLPFKPVCDKNGLLDYNQTLWDMEQHIVSNNITPLTLGWKSSLMEQG